MAFSSSLPFLKVKDISEAVLQLDVDFIPALLDEAPGHEPSEHLPVAVLHIAVLAPYDHSSFYMSINFLLNSYSVAPGSCFALSQC